MSYYIIVSWKATSKPELAKTTPLKPPLWRELKTQAQIIKRL